MNSMMTKISIVCLLVLTMINAHILALSQFNAVKVQASNKKIVTAGTTDEDGKNEFLVNRYNQDGSIDLGFNGKGFITTPIGDVAIAQDVELQADAKIIAGGFAFTGATVGALVRYFSTGPLDPSFGGDGIVTTVNAEGTVINRIAIQGDGRVVAVGATSVSGNAHIFLARYDIDGSLDGGFGVGGIVTLLPPDSTRACGADVLIVGTDIVVAASVDDDSFAIIKFDSTGTLDGTFGVGGITRTILVNPSAPFSLAVQADGRFILAGSSAGNITLIRYFAAGAIDGSFGSAGIVTTIRGKLSIARSIKINLDGTIVIGGQTDKQIINVKYDSTGAIDVSFGANGILTVDFDAAAQIRDIDLLSFTAAISATGVINAGIFNRNGLLVAASPTGVLNCGFNNNGILTFSPTIHLVTENFLFAATTAAQTLGTPFADITFDINGPVANWNHTPGTGTFTCQESGTYQVVYSGIYAETGLIALSSVSFIGLLNGAEITGSQLGVNLSVGLGSANITRNFIINACIGDRLQLQHNRSTGIGTITLDLIGSGTTPIGGTITITKLT